MAVPPLPLVLSAFVVVVVSAAVAVVFVSEAVVVVPTLLVLVDSAEEVDVVVVEVSVESLPLLLATFGVNLVVQDRLCEEKHSRST